MSQSFNSCAVNSQTCTYLLLSLSQPSDVPSVSSQPSSMPSQSPSLSTQPSSQPSQTPTDTMIPSLKPTTLEPTTLEPTTLEPTTPKPTTRPSISISPSTSNAPTSCQAIDITSPTQDLSSSALDFEFTSLLPASGDVAVIVSTRGDFINDDNLSFPLTNKFLTIETNGVNLGYAQVDETSGFCITSFTQDSFTITKDDFNSYIAGDDTLAIKATASQDVDIDACRNCCGRDDDVFIQLSYVSCLIAFPTSRPSLFPTSRLSLFPSVQPSLSSRPSLEPSTSILPSLSTQPSEKPSTSNAPTSCQAIDIRLPTQDLSSTLDFEFTSLLPASGDVAVNVFTRGDFLNSGPQPTGAPATNKFLTIKADGVNLGDAQGDQNTSNGSCITSFTQDSFTITKDDFNSYIAGDDTLAIKATASQDVNIEKCRGSPLFRADDVYVQLSYVLCLAAFPTSRPSLFPSVQPSLSTQPSEVPSISFAPTCTAEINDITSSTQNLMDPVNGNEFVFASLPDANVDVTITVSTRGDFLNTSGGSGTFDKFLTIVANGVTLGEAQGNEGNSGVPGVCITVFTEDSFTITKDDFNSYIASDGTLTIQATASQDVDIDRCRNLSPPRTDDVFVRLSYSSCTTSNPTSSGVPSLMVSCLF